MTHGRELLVGLIIISGAIVAVLGTLWLQGTNFGSAITRMDVLVSDVGQLQTGNQVKFRGVSIGRVAGIEVTAGGDAVRVILALENAPRFPPDARALIAPESMFGDWQCEIVSRSRFPTFDYYPVEGTVDALGLPVLGGYALPDISRLTAAADEISENLAVLTDRFDRAFNEETADALSQTVRNLELVSVSINDLIAQQAAAFDEVTSEVQVAANEIGEAAAVARSVFQQTDRMLMSGDVDSILVSVRRASAALAGVSEGAGQAMDGLRATLQRSDSALAVIDRLAGRLETGEGALGRLLTDTTFAAGVESAVGEFALLLQDIRENPGRYVRLSIF